VRFNRKFCLPIFKDIERNKLRRSNGEAELHCEQLAAERPLACQSVYAASSILMKHFHFVAGLKEPDHKPTVIPNVHYDLDRLLLPITVDRHQPR